MEITTHPLGSISFVDLAAAEPEKQGRFYAEVLGWEQLTLPGGAYTMFTSSGLPVAGMLPIRQPSDLGTQWSTYVTVADVDGICGQAEALNGAVLQAPFELAGAGRVAMIADPSGAAICVFEGWTDGGFKLFDEPGAPCWFEAMSTDARAALGFYEELFGWTATRMEGVGIDYWTCSLRSPPGRGSDDDASVAVGDDASVAVGDDASRPSQGFAGIMQYPAGASTGMSSWQVSFAIHTHIDSFIDRATELGAQVAAGPTDTTFGAGAIMLDPAGARFGAFDRSSTPD